MEVEAHLALNQMNILGFQLLYKQPLLINMEQTEDIVQGTCLTTCMSPSISFIIATACVLLTGNLFPNKMDWARWINRCGTL